MINEPNLNPASDTLMSRILHLLESDTETIISPPYEIPPLTRLFVSLPIRSILTSDTLIVSLLILFNVTLDNHVIFPAHPIHGNLFLPLTILSSCPFSPLTLSHFYMYPSPYY